LPGGPPPPGNAVFYIKPPGEGKAMTATTQKQLRFPGVPEKSTAEKFLRLYREQPALYPTFRRIADELRHTQRRYSARAIVANIRFGWAIQGEDGFKINDHSTPYLARLLAAREPKRFGAFFETRGALKITTDDLVAICDEIDQQRHAIA
jgi:hypothetical protein